MIIKDDCRFDPAFAIARISLAVWLAVIDAVGMDECGPAGSVFRFCCRTVPTRPAPRMTRRANEPGSGRIPMPCSLRPTTRTRLPPRSQ
jgi:hypothetical protein